MNKIVKNFISLNLKDKVVESERNTTLIKFFRPKDEMNCFDDKTPIIYTDIDVYKVHLRYRSRLPYITYFDPVDPNLVGIFQFIRPHLTELIKKEIQNYTDDDWTCVGLYLWVLGLISEDLSYHRFNKNFTPTIGAVYSFNGRANFVMVKDLENLAQAQENYITMVQLPQEKVELKLQSISRTYLSGKQINEYKKQNCQKFLEKLDKNVRKFDQLSVFHHFIRTMRNFVSHNVKFETYHHDIVMTSHVMRAVLFMIGRCCSAKEVPLIREHFGLPAIEVRYIEILVYNLKRSNDDQHWVVSDNDVYWLDYMTEISDVHTYCVNSSLIHIIEEIRESNQKQKRSSAEGR